MNTPLRRPVLHKTTSSFSYLSDAQAGVHPPLPSHTGMAGWRQPDRTARKWLVIIDYGPELVATTNEAPTGVEGGSLLAPLQSTAHQQVIHILPQLLLPTPLGLHFQLSLPSSTGSLPKITDAVWGQLFSAFLGAQDGDIVPREDFGGLPIAARLVLKVDHRQARWYEAWRRDPTEGTVAKWLDIREVARSLGHNVDREHEFAEERQSTFAKTTQASPPRPPHRDLRQASRVRPPLQPLSFTMPIGRKRSPRPSPLDLSALTRNATEDTDHLVAAPGQDENKEVGDAIPSPLESCTTFGRGTNSHSVPLSFSSAASSPTASSIHDHYPYGGASLSPDPRLPPVYPLAHAPRPPVSPPYSIISSAGPPSVRRVPHDPLGPADWVPTLTAAEGFEQELDTILPSLWRSIRVSQPDQVDEDEALRHWPYGLETPVQEWSWKGHEWPSPPVSPARSAIASSHHSVHVDTIHSDGPTPAPTPVKPHDLSHHEALSLPVNLDPHPWENDWPYLHLHQDAASARPVIHEDHQLASPTPAKTETMQPLDSLTEYYAVTAAASEGRDSAQPDSPVSQMSIESKSLVEEPEPDVLPHRRPRPSAIFPVRETPRAYDSPPPFSNYLPPAVPEASERLVSSPPAAIPARRVPTGPRAASSYTPQSSLAPLADPVRRAQSQSRPMRTDQAPPSSFTESSMGSSMRLYSVSETARQSTLSVTSTMTSAGTPKRPLKRLSQTLAGFSAGDVGSEMPLNCPRASRNAETSSTNLILSANAYPNLVIYPPRATPSFLYPDLVIYPRRQQLQTVSGVSAKDEADSSKVPIPARPASVLKPEEIQILPNLSKYPQLLLYPPPSPSNSAMRSLPRSTPVPVLLTSYSYPNIVLYPKVDRLPTPILVTLTQFEYPKIVLYPKTSQQTVRPVPIKVLLTQFVYPHVLLYPPVPPRRVQVLLQPISYPSLEIYPSRPIEVPILLTGYQYPSIVLYPSVHREATWQAERSKPLAKEADVASAEENDSASRPQADEVRSEKAAETGVKLAPPVEEPKSSAMSEAMISPARSFAALKANLARIETATAARPLRHTHTRDVSDGTTTSGSRTPGSALPTPRTMSPDSSVGVGLVDFTSSPVSKSSTAPVRAHLPHMARAPPAYPVQRPLEHSDSPARGAEDHEEGPMAPRSHTSPRARSSTLIADRMKSLFDLQQSPPPPAPSARYARSGTLSGGQTPITGPHPRGPLPPAPATGDEQRRPVGRLSSAMMKNWV